MGYIRIMASFFAGLVVILALMVKWIHHIACNTRDVTSGDKDTADEELILGGHWVHQHMSTETVILCCLHYLLFFMCYGASRMICQPWMWVLHFQPVLCLTILCV